LATEQRSYFCLRQIPNLARSHVVEPYRTEPCPAERDDRVADRLAHPTHLAVPPFAQRNLQTCVRFSTSLLNSADAHAGRHRPAAVDDDAARQASKVAGVGLTQQAGIIDALEFVPRMADALGKIAIIREQQQPFRVVVEPADRIEVAFHPGSCEKVDDRLTPLRIRSRAHHATRLVHQEVASGGCLRADASAVDADVIVLGIGLGSELGHDLPVHFHAALAHQRLGGAPRCDTGVRQNLLKPDLQCTWP
jgi:hypothetical protein